MRTKLREARKAAGLNQKQTAELLGIKPLTYRRIEYGQRQGKIATWDKLEDLFGIHQRSLREDDQR